MADQSAGGSVYEKVGGIQPLDKGSGATQSDFDVAKKQFPTMALEDLKATLDRSFADQMWSPDGMISRAAWDTGKAVVMGAGMLKVDTKYEDIIDMSFVESVRASL